MTTLLELKTPRLIASEFTEDDTPRIVGIFQEMHDAGQRWHDIDVAQPTQSAEIFVSKAINEQNKSPRPSFRLAVRPTDSPQDVIGYLSLCDLFSDQDGRPDTGILISPVYQRGGYGREVRLAMMLYAFVTGFKEIYADIAQDNNASIQNCLGMGYSQVMEASGQPLLVETTTINGLQKWFRYSLMENNFWEIIPKLVRKLVEKQGLDKSFITSFESAVTQYHNSRGNSPSNGGVNNNGMSEKQSITLDINCEFGPFVIRTQPSKQTPQLTATSYIADTKKDEHPQLTRPL